MKAFKVFVFNLSRKTEEGDLDDIFSKYGRVSRIKLKHREAVVVSIVLLYPS